uniref:Uncharacterized protein n=1 Tax=Strigamia maritima TaxID=126957 RepID=T1JEX5_STRMM
MAASFPSGEEYFRAEINNLRNFARLNGFSDKEIDICIQNSFETNNFFTNLCTKSLKCIKLITKSLILILLFTSLIYFLVSCHNPTKRFFSKYVQGLIYPFMRLLRICTLPIHDVFHTSHLYQESCLITNPFYKEPELDCWPCQQINFVMDLSGFQNLTSSYSHSGIPFVLREASPSTISLESLGKLYIENRTPLDSGTFRFATNIPAITIPWQLFSKVPLDPLIHCEWSLNKVPSTHILRRIFPRPVFVPKETEVALQKFLFLDGPQAEAYAMPLTDFANVWLTQGYGHRLVILEPSPQCQSMCSSISIVLQTKDICTLVNQLMSNQKSSINLFHSSILQLAILAPHFIPRERDKGNNTDFHGIILLTT